jgi:hypothetical protein
MRTRANGNSAGLIYSGTENEISNELRDLADGYQKEAVELLDRNEFREAAAKLRLAASESSKDGDNDRAKLFSAQSIFFDGLGTYLSIDFSGPFVPRDLERAVGFFQTAEKSFVEISKSEAESMARGWRVFMQGKVDELNHDYKSAKRQFLDAREVFQNLSPSPVVDLSRKQVELSMFSALIGEAMAAGAAEIDIGEIKRDIDQEKKANPDGASLYEDQFAFIVALNHFFQGLEALKHWDYDAAEKILSDSEDRIKNLKVSIQQSVPMKGMREVAEPLRLADQGGMKEAEGMKLLFEKKDWKKAGAALIEASELYRKSKTGFQETGWTGMGVMDGLTNTVRRHAHVISEAGKENLKDVTVGVGKWFLVFFVCSLLLLVLLEPYLKVGGQTDLQYSLLAGVLGGFGLKAPAILNALAGLGAKGPTE